MIIKIGLREIEFPDDSLKTPAFKRGVEDCLRGLPPREGISDYLDGWIDTKKQAYVQMRCKFTPEEINQIVKAVESVSAT
ncbi:MAG: hypothetical protein AAB884_00070 [Patescibacteria group bacterium]